MGGRSLRDVIGVTRDLESRPRPKDLPEIHCGSALAHAPRVRRRLLLLITLTTLGCGAKNGLQVPEVPLEAPDGGHDAAMDAGLDAGFDAGSDAGFDAGPPEEPCVPVPYRGAPQTFTLGFEARIGRADLVFLVDNTGSMGPLIMEIQDTLAARLIPGLASRVPDLQMAVAIYRDLGFAPFGSARDLPYELYQSSTRDVPTLQRAVDRMFARGGGDEPESATEALYQIATGEGLEGIVEPASCPDETPGGGACLRADAVPIVVIFTDAPFQNGPSLPNTYATVRPPPHDYPETVAALNAGGFRVLGMWVASGPMGSATRDDLEAIARDTGAVTTDGDPIVLDLGGSSRPLVGRVIDAITELVDESHIDVEAVAEDVPDDGVDATRFVQSITPLRATPPDGARVVGDRFVDVTPGTRVDFAIQVENRYLPPPPRTRRFGVRVTLRDGSGTPLVTRVFDVVVPGDDGGGCN